MNVGALRARHAPPFFLMGALLIAAPVYAAAAGWAGLPSILVTAGSAMLLAGWSILIWSASDIDR